MKNNVQIKNKVSGEILEFKSLDTALRTLSGVDSTGPKFNQILLTKPGKMTYKDAEKTIIKNGYEVVQRAKAEWRKTASVEIKVTEVVKEAAATSPVEQEIELLKHFQFGKLLALISAKINALLVGPAGAGKTMSAEAVAQELGLKYFSMSVGMQTTKTEFFGYMDAQGRYVRTLFREAYEFGGVFLIDELDAGNANVMTAMNQALANLICAFPDGMVKKHPDFVIISSANTYGQGANREYVGRNQLDAATLDRFGVIDWKYDTGMEQKLVDNRAWLELVWRCRRNAETYKIRTTISPRASINGAKLLAQGMNPADVMDITLRKGLNDTEWAKLIEGVKPESVIPPASKPEAKPEKGKEAKKEEPKKQEKPSPSPTSKPQNESSKKEDSASANSQKQPNSGDSSTPQSSGNSQTPVSEYEKMAVDSPRQLKDIADKDAAKFEEMKAQHNEVVAGRVAAGFPAKLSASQIAEAIAKGKAKVVTRFGSQGAFEPIEA